MLKNFLVDIKNTILSLKIEINKPRALKLWIFECYVRPPPMGRQTKVGLLLQRKNLKTNALSKEGFSLARPMPNLANKTFYFDFN